MRRILFLTLAVFIAYVNCSYAAEANATPTEYIVTINKVELYNSTISSWATVAEGDLTFDIAAFDAGQVAGAYASNTAIPEGVYTQERTTVSRTFYITASGAIGATTYYTTTGSSAAPGEPDGSAANTKTTASAVQGTCVLPTAWLTGAGFTVQGNYFYHEGNLPSPITVVKNSTMRLRIKFDVTNTVQFNDIDGPGGTPTVCYPLAPTVTFEVVD